MPLPLLHQRQQLKKLLKHRPQVVPLNQKLINSDSTQKAVGKIKIVGVKSAAIVMDRPDKNKAKNLGTVKLGDTISISGSVKGSNNAKG